MLSKPGQQPDIAIPRMYVARIAQLPKAHATKVGRASVLFLNTPSAIHQTPEMHTVCHAEDVAELMRTATEPPPQHLLRRALGRQLAFFERPFVPLLFAELNQRIVPGTRYHSKSR